MSGKMVEVSGQFPVAGRPEAIETLAPGSCLTLYDYSETPRKALIVDCPEDPTIPGGVYSVRLPRVVDDGYVGHDTFLSQTRAMIAEGQLLDQRIATIGPMLSRIPFMTFDNTLAELRLRTVPESNTFWSWLGRSLSLRGPQATIPQ